MVDTKIRQDLTATLDKVQAKAAEAVDTVKDGAERAQAGAAALGKATQNQIDDYRDTWAAADPVGDARDLAASVSSRAGDALSDLGKVVADKAARAGDQLGEHYEDVARSAARSIRKTAAQLETGDLDELGEAVRSFIRKNPVLTLGVATVAGYLVYRRLRKAPKADTAAKA